MPVPDSSFSLQQLVQSVASWTLAVVGFWWARRNGLYFAQRNEIKQIVADLTKITSEISASSIDYWMADNTSESDIDSMQIVLHISRLEDRVQLLKSLDSRFDLALQLAKFRQKTTGGQFQSKSRQKFNSNDSRIGEIFSAASELVNAAESDYISYYPTQFAPSLFKHKSSSN